MNPISLKYIDILRSICKFIFSVLYLGTYDNGFVNRFALTVLKICSINMAVFGWGIE